MYKNQKAGSDEDDYFDVQNLNLMCPDGQMSTFHSDARDHLDWV